MARIIHITKERQEKWDRFITENGGSFLHLFEWGEFQASVVRKVYRLVLTKSSKWIAAAQIFVRRLPLGKSWLYLPRSLVVIGDCRLTDFQLLLDELKNIGKKEKAIFVKFELADPESPLSSFLKENGVKARSIQPTKTIVLDITKSEEELLEQMHHKTRYNIRLAVRKGVEISISDNIGEFWRLLQKTTKRDEFKSHPKEYYERMLEIPNILLFTAQWGGKIIAANVVGFFGENGIYLHGASDYGYRKVMAPHLLQWEQIKEAKLRGCSRYDLWGIDENKWPGVTRFKRGFGGKEIEYLGAYDYVFSKSWYMLYNIARRL